MGGEAGTSPLCLNTGPGSSLLCPVALPQSPSPAEVSLHSTLPEAAYLACPAKEVSPVALAQGTIHSARLLIKTTCGVAGPAGGSSGNQAWPGAWGSGL